MNSLLLHEELSAKTMYQVEGFTEVIFCDSWQCDLLDARA